MVKKKGLYGKVILGVGSCVVFAMVVVYLAATHGSSPWPSRNTSVKDMQIVVELSSAFPDIESGIKAIMVDGSFIYVELDNSVSSSAAPSMSRVWARKLSEEYHSGRSCTAYITHGCRVLAKITYSKLDGYTGQSHFRNAL